MQQLYAMPGHLVRRIHQISGAIFAEEIGDHDLTSVQFSALYTIRASPGIDATRLSALIAFDRSTIGGVLERLEAKGWVVREPAPGDRRKKQLRLTADGETLLRDVEEAVARVQERLLAPLPPAERTTFMRLLSKLTRLHEEERSWTLPGES
ncbi:transcriptional regulator, MarR family [Roseomonas rosea]|uniref:Transcriptional regulator, MarR family n=2 Tax=Muricoccus roseus TaxID=198092 RepID=A0A1M6HJS7_9PROT|nr:transcriptional regulator, MarR family [Roseomonas rosea]